MADHRCEDCSLLELSTGDAQHTLRCAAPLPANVNFSWDRSEVPMGRFVSEVDFLKPCALWQGPVDRSEMDRRTRAADEYTGKFLSADHEWVNRFREKANG